MAIPYFTSGFVVQMISMLPKDSCQTGRPGFETRADFILFTTHFTSYCSVR